MNVKTILNWMKKEAVLTIAMLLAVISAFFVTPDAEYLSYIDFRTLSILFCLMAVMAGLTQIGVFSYVAEKLLKRVHGIRGLVFILIMLCFFSSMFITNDVALITFVPFTFIVLGMVLEEDAPKLIVPVVAMQTIAANLGSMLTPIGNPQNLFLYGKTGMNFGAFVLFMLPYSLISFLLLTGWCFVFPYHGKKEAEFVPKEESSLDEHQKKIVIYALLFAVCLLTVAHVISYPITLLIVVAVIYFVDKRIFTKVDYSLLLTFVGFFVFIGNMGRIPAFKDWLQQVIVGNEIMTGILASQFMSNVPAALLLSGFTSEYELLVIGTNLGGLGTLIASMASLISFKYIAKEYKQRKAAYLLYFTIANIVFLIALLVVVWVFRTC